MKRLVTRRLHWSVCEAAWRVSLAMHPLLVVMVVQLLLMREIRCLSACAAAWPAGWRWWWREAQPVVSRLHDVCWLHEDACCGGVAVLGEMLGCHQQEASWAKGLVQRWWQWP